MGGLRRGDRVAFTALGDECDGDAVFPWGRDCARDTDAASMAVSLETRLPLVDSTLTEVVNGLPDSERYANLGSKQLLRKIGLEGLDPRCLIGPSPVFIDAV